MPNFARFTEDLRALGISFEENLPLAPYTSFHIGGPARFFCEPASDTELAALLSLCRRHGIRRYLLGRGSNTLFSDAGFAGAVIHLSGGEIRFDLENPCEFEADAGLSLVTLCKKAAENGLSGLEFAYGIPGTVGGAVYMNAGAYDGEMAQVVTVASYLDETDALCQAKGETLCFGYRTSRFEQKGGVILRAHFALKKAPREEIEAKMAQLLQRRVEKQPLDKPSAGSTFKRPVGAFAAALIEECGLKGYQIGGAAVSEKHSGFVVNLGGASCADVVAVADHVARVVKEQTGYLLEREIRVVE